ncbi:PucR family transcriptional regulator [Streptomyces lunaelactis]|uniref:PucR family transcriptional regulator n=1 Tax=Streptomyces lunaelactis TaxID=1535768 RepID=A0A2R4SVQ1_9ACTN|nr:helix-turn-helix domain-containing protein [Streptomyces lunaelactis]AVZ70963.1 PucR family transcriptional regulator [Streptomyces lunaelactis]NUK27792.1 helix-turn-helix domain-containing protein [Streptomyces lunaelactis]NUK88337.1 helix-turn-helix domain-containing protein [Streptomyces lunaelactis]
MPTLGYLVDNRPELQLRFVEANTAQCVESKVATMVMVSHEELLGGRSDFAHPPGTLILLTLTPDGITGSTAAAVDCMLGALARYKAAGLVVTAPEHDVRAFPAATRTLASRLRVPLLTTTAAPTEWQDLNYGIQQCRTQYAERQVDNLAGLLHRLPAQLADGRAMQRITDWLAAALEAQVLVNEPKHGMIARAPATSPAHLAHAVITQAADPARVQSELERAGVHTRLVSLAPTRRGEAVLVVAAERPFDQADSLLIQHAAKLLGLVDQARRGFAMAAQSAREARAATYQLLMNGEPAKAQRVLEGLTPGLLGTDSARVYVIDCGSAELRETTVRSCEEAVSDRALVVRCPLQERHIVIVEPLGDPDPGGLGIAGDVQSLVLSLAGPHRLGGSGRRPVALAFSAYEEALTALGFTEHTQDPVVLTLGQTNLVDLLDPIAARGWALRVLAPIRTLPVTQAEQIERTLPLALGHPHTAAARILDVHRNTVKLRLNRAADLLDMDLGRLGNKVVIGLALDITSLPATSACVPTGGAPLDGELDSLLAGPRVRAWAEALLDPLQADRRDLTRTLQAWLSYETRVDATARVLDVSEVTVRSHLKNVEQATGRDLTTLAGLRDIAVALKVCTGIPTLALWSLAAA